MELSEASAQFLGADADPTVKSFFNAQSALKEAVFRDDTAKIAALERKVEAAFTALLGCRPEGSAQMMSVIAALLTVVSANEPSSGVGLVAQKRLLEHYKQLIES